MRSRFMRPDVAPEVLPGPSRSSSETHMFLAVLYGDLQGMDFRRLPEAFPRAPEGNLDGILKCSRMQ